MWSMSLELIWEPPEYKADIPLPTHLPTCLFSLDSLSSPLCWSAPDAFVYIELYWRVHDGWADGETLSSVITVRTSDLAYQQTALNSPVLTWHAVRIFLHSLTCGSSHQQEQQIGPRLCILTLATSLLDLRQYISAYCLRMCMSLSWCKASFRLVLFYVITIIIIDRTALF
jgi:hypothetical protein